MDFNVKEAAEKILKLAEEIEKEAQEKSYFVCDACNHTANLSSINNRRKEAASEYGIDKIEPVTIEDELSCAVPGCEGTMKYVATEESERFYVESNEDDEVGPDRQPQEEDDIEEEDPDEEKKEKTDEESEEEILEPKEIFEPVEDKPEKKEKPKKKPEDKPEDEKAAVPKKETPKFKKEKDANDGEFWAAVSKYSV